MKRFILAMGIAFGLCVFVTQPAQAVSPHFIFATGEVSGANLVVEFKEAGLGTNQQITYMATADGTATYVCVNGGNKNPSASNKTTVSGPVSATGTFSSGKNGQVTASLTLNPPGPGGFSCPNGQHLEGNRTSELHQRVGHRHHQRHHGTRRGYVLDRMPAA